MALVLKNGTQHRTTQIRVEDERAMLCSYRKSCKDIFFLTFEKNIKQKSRIALDRMIGKMLFYRVLVVRSNHGLTVGPLSLCYACK